MAARLSKTLCNFTISGIMEKHIFTLNGIYLVLIHKLENGTVLSNQSIMTHIQGNGCISKSAYLEKGIFLTCVEHLLVSVR